MRHRTFHVLGPVEVRDGAGAPLPLQPRPRAVLAGLLVDAGRVVPVDVLLDRAWDGRPPRTPATTLQATVSKLRRVLEPDVPDGVRRLLLTQPPGYRLAVPADDVDALRFPALLRSARDAAAGADTARARSDVAEALALWRGSAYADVPAAFAREEAARLEQLRLEARELAAELDLCLGRHAELVDELQGLVAAHPLREGLRASLMLALYRAGRQAEALQVHAEGRALLGEELGVDPGPALQRLHQQILRQDPALLPPSGPVRIPPPRGTPEAAAEPAVLPRGNLPTPLTSFVGRRRELELVAAAIGEHRLVTLVGAGGSGKTRLALEAVRRCLPSDRPAVLVELAGVASGDLVVDEVAAALGVNLTTGDSGAHLLGALRGRRLVLLLDNCEHVVDAVADLTAAVLTSCPELTVLTTSRQPLGVAGEVVLPCGPLPVGGPDNDAVRLFLDRALLVAPHLARPTDEERWLVATLCAELDGLPLALELAAACLTTLPLAEIAAHVDDRFALLAGARRAAPPHQRTLAATVQWSVDLLDDRERAVFTAASVFAGSFAPDAVHAVAAPDVGVDTLGPLRALAAHSLVEVDHDRGRYRMLETLRQFADQGIDDPARRRLRDRHAAFLVELAERLEPTLRRREGAASWRRLDAEQANLRSALAHLLETGQSAPALRLAGAISWWWYRRGLSQEGRRWLAQALAAAPGAPPPVRARALLGHALLCYLAGDVPALRASTDELVALPLPEDDGVLALALVLRGFVRALLGQRDPDGTARAEVERGLAVAERCGVDWVRAEVAMTLGQFARVAGDHAAALEHLDRAAALALDFGHIWAWCSVLWVRAKVLVDLGEGAEALRTLAPMVSQALSDRDEPGALAGLLTALGAATCAGHPRAAARLLGAVQVQGGRVGYDPLLMDPVDGQGYVARTRAALEPDEFAAAVEDGAALDLAAAAALVARLADEHEPEPARSG